MLENSALIHIGDMKNGKVVDFKASIALVAAKISSELKITIADSIILATARAYHATLWTQDSDFRQIDGVKYIQKML